MLIFSDDEEIILGIDPGTRISGYGVICIKKQGLKLLDYGCIRTPHDYKLSERYLVIYNSISELIEKFSPGSVVVETQYVHKNVQSAIKLGMARGTVIIAAKKMGKAVFEYPPTVAKKAVTGHGKASKAQVQGMVQRLLTLSSLPEPEDAADALSLAICHAHTPSHLRKNKEV